MRQVGDVYMLGLMGVDPATALVASLLRQLINYFYSLVGGAFFMAWKGTEPEGARGETS